ncbi:MAG: glycosyltransferase [Ilumatobacteraceae bacterium]
MSRRVFVSEHGNVFMREIAEHLVEAMIAGGSTAELVTDRLPEPGVDPLDQVVVAPHEFFALFPSAEADRERAAACSVSLNTEQAGTPFFTTAMQYAVRGPVVFDISPFSIDAVRRTGSPAVHLPLGYVASMDAWQGSARPRSVDLAFLAGRTPRREAFIGGAAGQLWEWRTDLRFFSWHRPARAHHDTFTHGVAKYESLADTRILLNVHRGDDPYFEWARVVEAVANGCVVATETSIGIAPLVPGRHMLMAPLESLAEEAVALAFDEPRRDAMARAAHEVLVRDLDQANLVDRAFAEARRLVADDRAAHGGRAGRRHAPRHARARVHSPRPATPDRQVLEATAKDLKQAYLTQLESIRAIERSLAIVRHGDADHATTVTSPAYEPTAPAVSVVIPLYNQGAFLAEAIDSVVAAAGPADPPLEVVVVDDHSTDDSAHVAERLLGRVPWLASVLVRRSANGGLPVARNSGFARARAPYVFALDADNVLYPNGLRVLAEHLDRSPETTVAAYGVLERFDDTGSLGLTSHLPWDVDLLVRGAFIDAMALFRRQQWAELGGYADNSLVYGWEDYDLWLAAAERGWRADLVPQVVGRYREQPGSMRKISDIDMATNFVTLRERHPRLAWPS